MKYITKLIPVILLICASSLHAEEPKERDEIAEKYKWDLTDMYVSTDRWEADILKYNALLPEIESYRGHLGSDGKTLLAAIQKMEEIEMLISDIFVYAGLKSYEDMRVGENSANFSRARTLSTKYNEATSYMRPELLAIPPRKLAKMISSTEGLGIYRHFIDEQLRMRDYTLSEAEERILASASDALGKFSSVYGAFNNADIKYGEIVDEQGNTVELTKARYAAFMSSTDRRVREDAWKGVYGEYERLGNTLAANYEGHVKARVFQAKIRGFDSALQAATYGNAIPTEVYTNLIEAARQGAGPLQRYMEIRRAALGVETLQPWDTSAPIGEETIKDVSFEEAKQIVADALTPLGDEYVTTYWKGFSEGWVDAYESQGKRGGAYSWGTYRSKPYLSMNYNGTFSSVSTLAHEYGHSIHSSLAAEAQPYTYANYRTFIAEIASMTNEAILFQKMLSEADSKEDKVFLLQTYLDEFRGGFYTQALFADYEMQAHAAVESGQALTKDSLNKIYHDTHIAYYGDSVQMDPLVDSTWSRIPHFLRNDNFYVYQYSTSFVAATALAKMILKEGEPARLRFLNLLRSGSNDYPIELLKKAGIDMTTAAPVIATIEVFDRMVSELEQTLKE
ncbi:MAG: oligoendopeptidase F [bacterium]|nr:oligoendopeptidase F [Gammaproteobacteria bacterium]HIL82185.1 oligoendopeptidase F [Pseudomonadales bacterium]